MIPRLLEVVVTQVMTAQHIPRDNKAFNDDLVL